jgi:hypothetical protein
MRSKKYPKIPTTRSQLTKTVVLAIVLVIFIYFFNPDGQLTLEGKRYLTRAGGVLIMLGGVLGGYVYFHGDENTEKRTLAEQTLLAEAEEFSRVSEGCKGSVAAELRLRRLSADIADAATALDQASNFEKTGAKVGRVALLFLVLGTILQFWGA